MQAAGLTHILARAHRGVRGGLRDASPACRVHQRVHVLHNSKPGVPRGSRPWHTAVPPAGPRPPLNMTNLAEAWSAKGQLQRQSRSVWRLLPSKRVYVRRLLGRPTASRSKQYPTTPRRDSVSAPLLPPFGCGSCNSFPFLVPASLITVLNGTSADHSQGTNMYIMVWLYHRPQ